MNHGFKRYANRVVDSVQGYLLSTLLIWGGFTLLLFVLFCLWHLFIETPVGRIHLSIYPERSSDIAHILGQNLLLFSAEFSLYTLTWSVIVSCVARTLCLERLFIQMSLPIKFLSCVLPFSLFISEKMMGEYGLDTRFVSFGTALFPSAFFLFASMKLVGVVVPEAPWLFNSIRERVKAWRKSSL
ncbi:MAG: hypothetical protein MI742_13175 [Desulfobacterales bacterium]|nr:hypothetical protein [Desulfobacterales bacterium]